MGRAFVDVDVFKARRGGGLRGTTGAAVPKSAPIHTKPRKGSPGYHHEQRLVLQHHAERARASLHQQTGRHMPHVQHGGFTCTNCGHQDWRLHRVATSEGKHHASLAFKGCAKCGTMHAHRL